MKVTFKSDSLRRHRTSWLRSSSSCSCRMIASGEGRAAPGSQLKDRDDFGDFSCLLLKILLRVNRLQNLNPKKNFFKNKNLLICLNLLTTSECLAPREHAAVLRTSPATQFPRNPPSRTSTLWSLSYAGAVAAAAGTAFSCRNAA